MPLTINLDQITGNKISFIPATEKTPGAISSQFTSREQALGNVTWACITPPAIETKLWRYTQSGNMGWITGFIKCSTPGLLVTSFSVPFPDGATSPWLFTGTENDEWVAIGYGVIQDSKSSELQAVHSAGIYKTAAGKLVITVSTGGVKVGAKYARFHIPYLVGD